jgi:hypothetical protein
MALGFPARLAGNADARSDVERPDIAVERLEVSAR